MSPFLSHFSATERRQYEIARMRNKLILHSTWMKAQRESNRRKQEGSILFYFPLNIYFHHVNRRKYNRHCCWRNLGTDSSKHILNHLENSEKTQQEKLDQIAKTFKSGFTGVTQTLVDIFKQRNRTPASSNEGPPAKRIRPQTSTDTRAKLRRPLQAMLYHKFNVNPRLCLVECAKLYIEIRKKLVSPEIK